MIQHAKVVPSYASRILIVEDEHIVARDLQGILQRFGYVSVGIASTGEEAIGMAESTSPDLILMDIVLAQGLIDGVETVAKLKTLSDVPVIYVTSHSDEATLKRASDTQPHGYVLKPINIRELQVSIEMGLYRHSMEKRFRENSAWLDATLRSIGDGVIATDSTGRIKFVNPVAQNLLGAVEDAVRGRTVDDVMRLREAGGSIILNPVGTAMKQPEPLIFEHVMLSGSNGSSTPVICTLAPIHDPAGKPLGCVLTLRDISQLHADSEELTKRVENVEHAKLLLERYFPENLVDYLVDERHQAELEGKNVAATMLFCDVRNSTQIAEALGPRDFAAFLSELFTGLMDLTYANGGSVNKLMGDGLLITFGCPFSEEDDTLNCVRLALQVREYLRAFNANRDANLVDPVAMGIGISTGIVFAGNVGSPRRLEYTVLGDAVNTASRLETLTKTAGRDILIDSATSDLVCGQIAVESVGKFLLRGRKDEQEVFFPVRML